jgi:hypothetical protein
MLRFTAGPSTLTGLLLFASVFPSHGQTISSNAPQSAATTGLVGVTSTQTARLNVLNLQPIIPGVAAVLCPATLEFYDDNGALLKQLAVTNISPTTAASLVYKPVVPTAVGARAQIRAVVLTGLNFGFNPGAGSPAAPTPAANPVCNLMASLEIFDDSTGATHILTTDLKAMPIFRILPPLAVR